MTDVLIVDADAAAIAAHIRAVPDGIHIAAAESLEHAERLPAISLGEVRALIAFPQIVDRALLARMPKLEWLQTLTAGIDPLAGLDLSGITLSNMAGAYAPQMSELAFLYMLAFARDVRGILARQSAAEWRPAPQRALTGDHAVIVGVGQIAEALARRCRAFDMHVTGVSQSRAEAPGFDRIVPRELLESTAASADYLIVLAPYSARNHHLVSRTVIAALPATAVLINIARGPVVDEAALLEALSAKRIAGAGLDVFTQEPLPPQHPFWRMTNVIVTPHIGGMSTRYIDQVAPLLGENINRWFTSPRQPLLNQVPIRQTRI